MAVPRRGETRSVLRCRPILRKQLLRPGVLATAVFLIYGFHWTDFDDFALLTTEPFKTLPDPGRQFLHSSPLNIFIGWPLTHLLGAEASFLIVTALGLFALAFSLRFYLRRLPEDQRDAVCLVLLSSPLLVVILAWLGKSDPCLLALFLVLSGVKEKSFWALVLSALMVVSHKEIGTIMLIGDCVLRRKMPAALILGAALAYALVYAYQAALSEAPFSRIDLGFAFLKPALAGWRLNPLTHLALGFGWFWFVLAMRSGEPDLWRVLSVVALCFAAAFTTADFTRDLVLCASPLILYSGENVAADPRQRAMVSGWPVPLLGLVQGQIQSFSVVRDTLWPEILPHMHWFG